VYVHINNPNSPASSHLADWHGTAAQIELIAAQVTGIGAS